MYLDSVHNERMRHLLADSWRSLGSAPVLGRVCARHLGAGATSLSLHTAVIALDGKPLFNATDRSLPQAGAMGVWSQADSITHYGSLLVAPVTR